MFLDAARVAPEKAVLRPALPMFLRPGWNGTDMTKLTYSEQLRHPNWQRKRLEVMEAAAFSCESCGDTETTLNVHHRRYVKGRMAWEYERSELQCLCQPCHAQHHEHRELLERLLMNGDGREPQAIGLLGGYCAAMLEIGEEMENEAIDVGGESYLAGAVAGLMRPQGRIGWPEIAAAIRALYEPAAPYPWNPAEEHLLQVMESMREAQDAMQANPN